MSEFRTDEESIELIKSWWKENGTFLIVGVGVVIAAVLGYQAWQRYQGEQSQLASQRFTTFSEALRPGSAVPDATRALLLTQLKDEHGGTGYGPLAALLEAKRLVERSEFDAASKELQWVIDTADVPSIVEVARIRLARVLAAKGDVDAALRELDGVAGPGGGDAPKGAALALLEEVRGDLLLAKGDRAGAHAAYVRAIAADKENPDPVLTVKRDDVAPGAAVESR